MNLAMNPSGLKPLGHAVLVKPYEPELGQMRIVIPDSAKAGMAAVEQRAIVIAVGPEAWRNEEHPRAKPGDKVLVSRHAGYMAIGPADGEQYRMVNANDVFAQIVAETVKLKEAVNG
ncbi:MAG: co-chaperone GroES [Acidiferrobacteraceae bacterium]